LTNQKYCIIFKEIRNSECKRREYRLLVLKTDLLKKYVEDTGIKQKILAERAGINESALCFILQGKRKCEAGEYGNLCFALGVPLDTFLKPEIPEKGVI
jgi:hypothetical protein